MLIAAIFVRGGLESADDQKIIYQVRAEELLKISVVGLFSHILSSWG